MPILGEFADEFDANAICDEVTVWDDHDGYVWRADIDEEYELHGYSDTLNAILEKHDLSATTTVDENGEIVEDAEGNIVC